MTLRAASEPGGSWGQALAAMSISHVHIGIFLATRRLFWNLMSCHELNDRLDSIRPFETVATESGRSIPLNVPPACEAQAPGPNQLGAHLFGVRNSHKERRGTRGGDRRRARGQPMPDIQAMTKQLNDQLKRESESLDLWNSFEPVTVMDQRRKTFNVRSEMITRCKLNIQKYRETIAALEEQAGK